MTFRRTTQMLFFTLLVIALASCGAPPTALPMTADAVLELPDEEPTLEPTPFTPILTPTPVIAAAEAAAQPEEVELEESDTEELDAGPAEATAVVTETENLSANTAAPSSDAAPAPAPTEAQAEAQAVEQPASVSEPDSQPLSDQPTTQWDEGPIVFKSASLQGAMTASGEPFDKDSMTAAHKDLPFGTMVTVINPANDLRVVVRVNDRMPGHVSAIIDISPAAAEAIDMVSAGIIQGRIEW